MSGIAELWHSESILEKSAIPLRILQTPFGSVSLLYGPRQIGKTSSLKLFLSQLSDTDTAIFTDCSVVINKEDLYKHLRGRIHGASTVVLDEVQAVPDWHLAIRTLCNEGALKGSRLWCTGSEARYLLESGERLPGRKGQGRIVFARPWSFREYMQLIAEEDAAPFRNVKVRHITQDWVQSQKIDWSRHWQAYLRSGGFPRPLAELHMQGRIEDETYRIYEDWILGSWTKVRTPERSLRALLGHLVKSLNSRTSFEALAKGTDIASPNTVRSLLELQEDHFALRLLTRYDAAEKRFKPSKQKKVFALDPFLVRVIAAAGRNVKRGYFENDGELALDECAFFSQFLRFEEELPLGYLYAEKSKSEVDFAVPDAAFELKSRGAPTPNQYKILNLVPHAFVLRKETLPLMAYLVGQDRDATSGF